MSEHENPPIEINSEEVQEIITAVPSWILRWGITLVFLVLTGIIVLSALIEYPNVIKTTLRVNSLNAPKIILSNQNGKISSLLAEDGDHVVENQMLAFFETTANPKDILDLLEELKKVQKMGHLSKFELPVSLKLGEIQGNFQSFYQEYLQYQSTKKNGYYVNQRAFLERELTAIRKLNRQILKQKQIQVREYANAKGEYNAYKQLYAKKVISRSEFNQQENKYLAAKYPLQQTETSLLNNASSYLAKEKELFELENTITQQRAKFVQALNKFIAECEAWVRQYVLRAPISGRLNFAGIVQKNQNVTIHQEIFIINPGNAKFFGEIQIPQYNMGKIHIGERVLVKLHSYPFEQYGMIKGKLAYISDAAYRDSVFIGKINFEEFENKNSKKNKIVLKNGMLADVMIITEESSILQRFFRTITKMVGEY